MTDPSAQADHPEHTNSLGEEEPEPQQTDNGPKDGDGEPNQDAVQLPSAGEHEGAGLGHAVLAEAMRHRGTVETPPGSNRQRFGADFGWNGVAWCNIFVSQVGRAVAGDYDLLGRFAGTIACAGWWDQQGRFGREPRPGAAVFFDWKGGRSIGAIDHIGLVIEPLGNGRVRTIEGNAAIQGKPDGVWVHDRSTRFIVGYGYPRYTTAGPAAPRGPRVLRVGDVGEDVRALQRALHVSADGEFGPQTKTALVAFQKGAGLLADGEAGPKTLAALKGSPAGPAKWSGTRPARQSVKPPVSPTKVPPFPGFMRNGSKGTGVKALQQRLKDRGWKITVDGDFGPGTDQIVRSFQKDKGLAVDGEVGPKTWGALWTTPVT